MKFVKTLPENRPGRPLGSKNADYDPVRAILHDNPRLWGEVKVCPDRKDAHDIAWRINVGQLGFTYGHYEAAARQNTVYVRYLGTSKD
jgi:hypothetical protein